MTDINSKIKKDIQTLNVGSPEVKLFELDASIIGGSIYRFTPGPLDHAPVVFNSLTYTTLPVEIEGLDWGGDGKMPRPKISISNIFKSLQAEVIIYNDFIDASIKIKSTYKKYIDGQSEADPNAEFPYELFFIKKRTQLNKFVIGFELRAAVDVEKILIPRRQVLPICGHTYRIYTGPGFDYTYATCPYTDVDYYTIDGVSTTIDNDVCGHDLFGCRKRFPSTNNTDDQLPGRFFPGVGKFSFPFRR